MSKRDDKLLIENNLEDFRYGSVEIRSDKEIVIEVAKLSWRYFEDADDELKYDTEILWYAKKYFELIRNIESLNINFKWE